MLEELPGDNALSAMPDSILKTLHERLKLELKIEEAIKGTGKSGVNNPVSQNRGGRGRGGKGGGGEWSRGRGKGGR